MPISSNGSSIQTGQMETGRFLSYETGTSGLLRSPSRNRIGSKGTPSTVLPLPVLPQLPESCLFPKETSVGFAGVKRSSLAGSYERSEEAGPMEPPMMGPHLQKPSNGPAERNICNGIFDDHLSIPYINSELYLDKRNYLNILKRFKHKLGLVQTNRSLKTETLLRYKTYKDPMGIHSGISTPSYSFPKLLYDRIFMEVITDIMGDF